MLGLSALVAKVWPGVVKTKQPVLTVIETPRYYFAGVDVAYGDLCYSTRDYPGPTSSWKRLPGIEWNGEIEFPSNNQEPKQT